ncbi:hypothetical protein F5Y19DRAFT_381575 [Xylariaceae sp. FL1651]|nr:hypothetical protein F5Y19DRAFT_381575 [Xylariaceae sp. FL1651]
MASACCKDLESAHEKALQDLNKLIASSPGPLHDDSLLDEDEDSIARRIKLLGALNDFYAVGIAELAHNCQVCKVEDSASPIEVARALVEESKANLEAMEALLCRMQSRAVEMQKLKMQAAELATIREAMPVMAGESGSYAIGVDPKTEGCGLELSGTDTNELEQTSTLASPGLPSILTPGLAAAPAQVPEQQQHGQPDSRTEASRDGKSSASNKKKPRFIALKHDVPEGKTRIEHYGVAYSPAFMEEDPSHECRMVIFYDLDPATTIADVLLKVRGGLVLSAFKADGSSFANVAFADWRAARAYVRYVDARRAADTPLRIRGRTPSIALAQTPSYPLSLAVKSHIMRGRTRCLTIRYARRSRLFGLLDDINIWPFVANWWDHRVGDQGEGQSSDDGEGQEKTWEEPDDNDDDAPRPHTLYLWFRAISHACRTYATIVNDNRFVKYRDLAYFADPCAGALEELND